LDVVSEDVRIKAHVSFGVEALTDYVPSESDSDEDDAVEAAESILYATGGTRAMMRELPLGVPMHQSHRFSHGWAYRHSTRRLGVGNGRSKRTRIITLGRVKMMRLVLVAEADAATYGPPRDIRRIVNRWMGTPVSLSVLRGVVRGDNLRRTDEGRAARRKADAARKAAKRAQAIITAVDVAPTMPDYESISAALAVSSGSWAERVS
jgi:hypothetical protein